MNTREFVLPQRESNSRSRVLLNRAARLWRAMLLRIVAVGAICQGLAGVTGVRDAWAAAKGQAVEEKYQRLVATATPDQIAKEALAAANGDRANEELEALGKALAVEAGKAAAVLEALAGDASVAAATVRAELLVAVARGDETPAWARKGRTTKPAEMTTDELGRRAAELLDHADPFVRGLAEWAIAIRLGAEYEGAEENVGGRRLAKEWPGPDSPAWYQRWAAIGPDAALELDYVRQAAALGWHRNSAELLKSAATLVERAQHLLTYCEQNGTPEQAALCRAHAC